MAHSSGAADPLRLSEWMNEEGVPPGRSPLRDEDLEATCPTCGVTRDMASVNVRAQFSRLTYRCPDDKTVLAMVSAEPESMKMHVKVAAHYRPLGDSGT